MKKILSACCLMLAVVSTGAIADARSNLQARLNEVSTLHADFKQSVYAADGAAIQQGEGELWLKRPNLFRWHMIEPDESILVSDGKTLWFFNPFVEQVTATWLKDIGEDTPFMLIARNSNADWNNYTISQKGDLFELTPKNKKDALKPFEITVNKNGKISSFVARELDGQRSVYQLENQSMAPVDASNFTFTPPPGVTLDDQRQ